MPVGRWQLFHQVVVHPRPIGVFRGLVALFAPPDPIASVKNKVSLAALDGVNHLTNNPVAAVQTKHRTMYAWQELHVLHGSLCYPPLIQLESSHFSLGHERH